MRYVMLCLMVFWSAASFAELTPGTPAPEFPKEAVWLGGSPHAFSGDLKGKVVLVDFWEYTCINCIRTFPHLKFLYERYHKYGFEIIGVHKGEFAIASDASRVRIAYNRFKLPYPGVADTNDALWKAYDCNSWPDSFLVDRDGIIRENHQGEGDYDKLELAIRQLLKKGHPEIDFTGMPIASENPSDAPGCGDKSDEIYIGFERGALWGGQIANTEGFQAGRTVKYAPTTKRVARGFFAEGAWINQSDDFESVAASTASAPALIGISYHGREVYAVLDRSTKGPVQVIVTRDGKPLPENLRGKDVSLDTNGETVITIGESRMYYVVKNEDSRQHELRLIPAAAGVRICSFTFGNGCEQDFERL